MILPANLKKKHFFEMAKIPCNYLEQYNALPRSVRSRILRALRKWGAWTKPTAYRKMGGESLTPIETVLVSGVMKYYTQDAGFQQEISFVFDSETGIKAVSPVFCESVN